MRFIILALTFISTIAFASTPSAGGAPQLFDMIKDKATTVDQINNYLKTNPVPVDAVTSDGLTPLAATVVFEREEIFHALYDYYRHPNLNKPVSAEIKMWTLYDYILQGGTVSWIDYARAQGGKVVNKDGRTELFEIVNNKIAVVQEFIRRGAKINQTDKNGVSPLMVAAGNGRTDTVKELLADGADVKAHDKAGKTALIWATSSFSPETVQALVDAHSDVNAHDKRGRTALLELASDYFTGTNMMEDDAIFDILMKAGADINARDVEGKNVFMVSTGLKADLVKKAISYKANVNSRDNDRRTPLIWLAFESFESNDTEAFSALLTAGADVNAQDKFGQTALIMCSGLSKCGTPILQLLVASGADRCLRSQDGTALEEAIRYEHDPANYGIIGSNKCPPRANPTVVIVEQSCHLELIGLVWQTVCN